MALWDRKIHWQFGGNVQPVRMICEVDWKSCPSTILNYLWSEIVTDVIDYVTLNDGILWRVITITFCLLIILYTLWTKIMETIENIMKEQIFNGINFKLENLEMRVSVLAYRMQYGTWPLPPTIDTNSVQIIKAEESGSFSLGSHYPWLNKFIPKYMSKSKNVKFHPSKTNSINENPHGVYDGNLIAQMTHSKRRLRKKCVKCIQSNKRVNANGDASQKKNSMEIQCQKRIHCDELSDGKERIEIPLKFLNNSPKITKLFRSTKITLAKVRQRLESLHTVLKVYRSGEGIDPTEEKNDKKVNLLDSFLQELSDLQSGTESDEYRIKSVCISDYEDNAMSSPQIDDDAQCNDQDFEKPSSVLPMDVALDEPSLILEEIDVIEMDDSFNLENFQIKLQTHENGINMKCAEGDVLFTSSKNCYSLQILDSIVEEQSGNSCNEQPINSDRSDDQEVRSKSVTDEYVNANTNCEDEKHHSPTGDSMLIEDTTEVHGTQDSVETDCRGVIAIRENSSDLPLEEFNSEDRKDVKIMGGNNEMMLTIHKNNLLEDGEFSEVRGIMSNIIICSTTPTVENLGNNYIIEEDSCCSAFIKLEKIRFQALTEVEKTWTDELFVGEQLKCNEPLILKNWFTNTGINFTINLSSDEFTETKEHKTELQLVVKDNINFGAKEGFSKLPHEVNLLLNVSSTDSMTKAVIEEPKSIPMVDPSPEIIEENTNFNPSCLKPRASKINLSRSNTDLSPRRSKLHGIPIKYERSPRISPDSIHRRYKIKAENRSSSLDSIWKKNRPQTRSKSGIPVLRTRYMEEPRNPNYRYNSPRRAHLPMSTKSRKSDDILDPLHSKESNRESTCSSEKTNHQDPHSEEQTIVYINIINEQRDDSMKMENSQEFSNYVKENIYKIRGLTEYIKNSGVSKIVTIVCSAASQNTDDESKDIEIVPHRKFIIDTSTLV